MISIGLIQTTCTDDPAANLDRTVELIEKAAADGSQIICLQELFNTSYFCREISQSYFTWAESIPGKITRQLTQLADKHNIVIVAPFFERQAAGIYYNSLVVIDADGSLLGTYRKMHLPDDPGFYEKYYFTPGDRGFQVYETAYGKIGTLICWDQWYPEAARITAMKGADLLVYPTAIATMPGESDQDKKDFLDAWQTIQRSHAIANGCYVASINRVGLEGGSKFWGHSFVAGPFGQLLAEAGETEEILTADIDFSKIEKQRQIWPFFRDRRIESYDPILKRWLDKLQQ
ncbi:MAG: carbon-nitrogen hydrolase [Balneolaceae bacterium]